MGAVRLDGEARFRSSARAIPTVAAASGCRLWTAGTAAGGDGAVAGFHVDAAVAFVGADGSGSAGAGGCVAEGTGALEFAEDGFFVVEEVPN